MGLVEGLLLQKPASPVLTTPTHAEMVARLHELYDSEKKVSKKVKEAKGGWRRLGLRLWRHKKEGTEVDRKFKEFRIKRRPVQERKRSGRRGGGGRRRLAVMMEDTVLVEEAGISEEVGVLVQVGKEEEGCQATRFFREWCWFGKCKIGC